MNWSRLAAFGVPVAGALAYWRFVRPWHLRWGATDEEVERHYPGDDLVPDPRLDSTRAITIDAPAEDVWPWLAQIGQHRGGFYSYAWLENLVGCKMANAARIVPEWQRIERGDKMWLHPKAPPLDVLDVIPGRSIVLGTIWAFHLDPVDAGRTRLIIRGRGAYTYPDLKLPPLNFLYWRGVFEPAHFIMERKMLLGIKERAEREYARKRARRDGAEPETRGESARIAWTTTTG